MHAWDRKEGYGLEGMINACAQSLGVRMRIHAAYVDDHYKEYGKINIRTTSALSPIKTFPVSGYGVLTSIYQS